MSDDTPSQIGEYKVIAKIGQGGMAQVLLALKPGAAGFRKLVVLKRLRDELTTSDEYTTMFLDEARIAARMSHPNVVQAYEVGEDEGAFYIAMEYLRGQSFSRVLRQNPSLPLPERIRILSEALMGLHYAHELKDFDGSALNVVHRDVSPHNIFVTYDGQVQLLDFGVAKSLGASTNTRAGTFKGKVAYIAPEQALGQTVDRRADVFSLGVVLWELVALRKLSKGDQDLVRLNARIQGAEPRLREVMPDVDPVLLDACDKAMAVDPADRYSSAEEFRVALRPFLDKHPSALEKIGEWMSASFATERDEIRTLVEKQVQAHEDEVSAEIPVLSVDAPITSTELVPVRSSSRGYAVGAVGLVAAAALAWFVLGREAEPAPVPPPPPPQNAINPEPVEPALAEHITLTIEAEPSSAILTLDGTPLGSNPFRAEVSLGGELHRIEMSAPGYVSHEQVVVFDRDQEIRVELEAVAEAPDPAASDISATRMRRRPRESDVAEMVAEVVTETPPDPVREAQPPPAVMTTMNSGARPIDETDPYQ